MKKYTNIGVVLGLALAMKQCSTLSATKNNIKCDGDLLGYKPRIIPPSNTKFIPNSENDNYRKKHLNIKKRSFKK